jgi:hypothetical protein
MFYPRDVMFLCVVFIVFVQQFYVSVKNSQKCCVLPFGTVSEMFCFSLLFCPRKVLYLSIVLSKKYVLVCWAHLKRNVFLLYCNDHYIQMNR